MKRIAGCAMALLSAVAAAAGTSDVADAVMNRNQDLALSLLAKKADVNAAQPDGTTALLWAVRQDDLKLADALIASGADVNAKNQDGATAMYLACVNGDPAMVERLLKAGVDPNATFLMHGETALMEASRTGNLEAVKLLLEHGAAVNAKETLRQTTAAMWASEQDHADVVKLLAGRGADLSLRSGINEPKKRYGVNYKGTEYKTGGLTALVLAAREGALTAVQALVEAKADVNQAAGDGSTAMLVAIQNGHYDVATFLLNHGADPNLANEKGWNPLYLAVKHRNIETGTIPVPNANQAMDFIQLLLDKGANPNLRLKANTEIRNGQRATWLNEAGATPFLRAALCGDIEVMKLLLKHGADPKITTDDHTTPLMAAAGVGYTDGFIHDRSEEETIEAMKMILDLGASVNDKNDAGLTALHGAAHKASLAEIKLLVGRGADLSAKDNGGSESSKRYGQKSEGLLPLDWAEGVTIGVQSAIYHAEAVELISSLMKEQGIPMPVRTRTIGGNAVAKK
ncbi:MAG: ankyrin repeat domain-containing protein [Acidobacteriia bacterium]|nr:ankyrin repeat domain-containing protein [Terriglobia bacterium]